MGKRKPFLWSSLLAAGVLALGACVTINVYFPAAEAQQAAEEFVEKVLGDEAPAGGNPQSWQAPPRRTSCRCWRARMPLARPPPVAASWR